jgi:SpoVK/Ycf46/Vps4 family AAA+-type ATPase
MLYAYYVLYVHCVNAIVIISLIIKSVVVVIAATNRVEDLDIAVLRRFDAKVCFVA